VVSRQLLNRFKVSTVICAPVFTNGEGLSTQVAVDLKRHEAFELGHVRQSRKFTKRNLTNHLGSLSSSKLLELNRALKLALDL